MTSRTIVSSPDAPRAIGPYSQAVRHNGLIFCSGQIPLDPTTGKLVNGGIEEQTRRVLQNLQAVLAAGGSSLAQVLKATVFLADMGDFAGMNKVYGEFFASDPPARAAFQVARLPLDSRVEIEVIAACGDA